MRLWHALLVSLYLVCASDRHITASTTQDVGCMGSHHQQPLVYPTGLPFVGTGSLWLLPQSPLWHMVFGAGLAAVRNTCCPATAGSDGGVLICRAVVLGLCTRSCTLVQPCSVHISAKCTFHGSCTCACLHQSGSGPVSDCTDSCNQSVACTVMIVVCIGTGAAADYFLTTHARPIHAVPGLLLCSTQGIGS
mgnify:CR=1 FL=1